LAAVTNRCTRLADIVYVVVVVVTCPERSLAEATSVSGFEKSTATDANVDVNWLPRLALPGDRVSDHRRGRVTPYHDQWSDSARRQHGSVDREDRNHLRERMACVARSRRARRRGGGDARRRQQKGRCDKCRVTRDDRAIRHA
jgi:hypothetical protein